MDTSSIPRDYEGLIKEYKLAKTELEEAKQELYDCKRQLKVAEALHREYACEIELLQNNQGEEFDKLKEKIIQLEENLSKTRLTHSIKINAFELDLIKKDEEIELLKTQVKELESTKISQSEDSGKFVNEVLELKSENEQLLFDVYELTDHLKNIEKEKQCIEQNLSQYIEENATLKEMLATRKEQIEEQKELIQKLNDDIFCLKTELESFKNQPLDQNTKGNSLFAEVNDRRVYLQETINKMKADYIQMKQERAKYLKEISHLKKENVTLCERWKSDIKEINDDRNTVIHSLQNKISVLETLVSQHQKSSEQKTSDQFEYELFQELIDLKSKEIEDLHQQLMCKASTEVQLTHSLTDANRELRRWRAEALMAQQQLEDSTNQSKSSKQHMVKMLVAEESQIDNSWKPSLKGPKLPDKETRIEEIKRIKQIPSILKTQKEPVEIERTEKRSIMCPDNINAHFNSLPECSGEDKENELKSGALEINQEVDIKRVTFSESTQETNVTYRSSIRSKRVIVPTPTYFISNVDVNKTKENISCETVSD